MAGQETTQNKPFKPTRFCEMFDEDEQPEDSESVERYFDKRQGITERYLKELMHHKKVEADTVVEELPQYKSLFKAIASNDWEEVKMQLDLKRIDFTTPITESCETILHILVNSSVKALWLVKEIVHKIDPESLLKTDYQRDTALHTAAYAGNAKAAEMMAKKNPSLLTTFNNIDDSPLHAAARYGHQTTFRKLLSLAQNTDRIDKSIFIGKSGATVVEFLVSANLFDLAVELLNLYPKLCRENLTQRRNILVKLAGKPLEFESGFKFRPWERLIYKAISVTDKVIVPPEHDDCLLININVGDHDADPKWQFRQLAYSIIGSIFPSFERIRRTKSMNEQVHQILISMCSGVTWTSQSASYALRWPLLKAASLGTKEVVQEILCAYPGSMMFTTDHEDYNILQLAVLYRREKVFNLIFKMGLCQRLAAKYTLYDKGNILHLAGKCVIGGDIHGSALQMQQEMQWFKAVETIVYPWVLEAKNEEKKTARQVFAEERRKMDERHS